MSEAASILIVNKPGRSQEGLRALVRATPGLNLIGQADTWLAAFQVVSAQPPVLVLLGDNLSDDELLTNLRCFKAAWPDTRYLVLANSARQGDLAYMQGAHLVLRPRFSITQFFSALEQLLVEVIPPCH